MAADKTAAIFLFQRCAFTWRGPPKSDQAQNRAVVAHKGAWQAF
jgi:hypothetical protein